jgi:hypothetical protein
MQDFVDSLCQCFGTNIPPADTYRSGGPNNNIQPQLSDPTQTPKVRRRRSSSTLRERQWETIFSTARRTPRRNSGTGNTTEKNLNQNSMTLSERKSSSKSNQQTPNAQTSQPVAFPTKRKRSTGSRDEIFRTKSRLEPSSGGHASNGSTSPGNPFSRFLSNHPAIINSLCFATPIKGSSAEDNAFTSRCGEGVPIDAQSVITACDDETDDHTMTSTVYYETTKLAGLRQNSPPMPLFKHFAVAEQDDIHTIVASHSHSSARLIDVFLSDLKKPKNGKRRGVVEMEPVKELYNDDLMMQDQTEKQQGTFEMDYDDIPPSVVHCSSDSKSSKSSDGNGK